MVLGMFAWECGLWTYVTVVVDEQRDFGGVTLLPFVTGQVADQVAVYRRAVVEVTECVEAGVRIVGINVCLLCCYFQRCKIQSAKALQICAIGY